MSYRLAHLTEKQKKVFLAIESYMKTNRVCPSIREISEQVGIKTPGAVQGILDRLEKKGVIKRTPGKARSIIITSTEFSYYLEPVFIPELINIGIQYIANLFDANNIEQYHPISPKLITTSENYFILDGKKRSFYESVINYKNSSLLFFITKNLNINDIVLFIFNNHLLLRHFTGTDNNKLVFNASSPIIKEEAFNPDDIVIIAKLCSVFTII